MTAAGEAGMGFLRNKKGWHCFRVLMGCCETGRKGSSVGKITFGRTGWRWWAGKGVEREPSFCKTGVNGPKPAAMYQYFAEMKTFNWRATGGRSLLAASPPEKILPRTLPLPA